MKDDTQAIDLSITNYEQWIRLLFEHPVPQDEFHGKHWHDGLEFEISDATVLVPHVTRMCREMTALDTRFSPEQIDQGIWLLLGCQVRFVAALLDVAVPSVMRRDCIRSMYDVYAGYAGSLRQTPTCFEMWWDLLCHEFWAEVEFPTIPQDASEGDVEELLKNATSALEQMSREMKAVVNSPQSRRAVMADNATKCRAKFNQLTSSERDLLEVFFETLSRILELPDSRSQYFALHGLGHLYHPAVPTLLDNYLKAHKDSLSDEQRQYVQDAAQGMVM